MSNPESEADALEIVIPDERHCYHHTHNEECGYGADGDCDDGDDCVHCDCCCTCLGCEYGPQDGMLMYPNGAPWGSGAVVTGE